MRRIRDIMSTKRSRTICKKYPEIFWKSHIMSTKPKMLDLFCGTKSVAHAFMREGFDVTTLDNDLRFAPDIWTDILDWNYRELKSFDVSWADVIWASPPCEGFSVAAISKNWKKDGKFLYPKSQSACHGMRLVIRTLEIIQHIKPRYWFIENPRAALRKQVFMQKFQKQTITYCQYGDIRMKPTDIWGVFPKAFPIRSCKNGDSCHETAPRGSRTGTQGLKGSIERGRIPAEFCSLLAEHIKQEMRPINMAISII